MSFRIDSFPRTRIIGVATRARGGAECAALWERHLMPRQGEIQTPDSPLCFGIARCIPGATDGSYEYIAAFEATPSAAVPRGMMELTLGDVQYAVFDVPNLDAVGGVWEQVPATMAAHPELVLYCGEAGCGCAQQPSFELYGRDYEDGQPFSIYVPLKART